jgi:hypothetical protein
VFVYNGGLGFEETGEFVVWGGPNEPRAAQTLDLGRAAAPGTLSTRRLSRILRRLKPSRHFPGPVV